jgi:hypothetical protein
LETLVIKNNFYVVEDAGRFYYYPVKVKLTTLNHPTIIRFAKGPPKLLSGVVMVGKKVYEITADDILRGVIRKSREVRFKKDKVSNARTVPTEQSSSPPRDTSDNEQDSVECNTDNIIRVEEQQAADDAWNRQVEALLGIASEKEGGEWEVEGTSQP